MPKPVRIIGAGLAGCEAAYQLASRGIPVTIYEMKPEKKSPAHSYGGFAELVCSNSLRSDRLANGAGLLKEEMRRVGSLIMQAAEASKVPAGGALAVDRYAFSDYITNYICNHPLITVNAKEMDEIADFDGITIVASGPLTSEALSRAISREIGEEYLHFFDAAAPIVTGESIDMSKAFWGSRYERGSDYINCPMTKEEYDAFYQELINAECVELHGFEQDNVFEGCMPVEVMAKRGYQTLLFGPCKPVGLAKTGEEMPYAVIQLRKEDAEGRLFNIVGFQTHLKFPEQKRVFSMIPGLENAEFTRLGVMHRNTYLNSPKLLDDRYRLRSNTDIFFAGQMTGVEGYVESTASGLYAGICAAYQAVGQDPPLLTAKTAIGALAAYISNSASVDFQPMNITFGIMDEPSRRMRRKSEKRELIAKEALEALDPYIDQLKNFSL